MTTWKQPWRASETDQAKEKQIGESDFDKVTDIGCRYKTGIRSNAARLIAMKTEDKGNGPIQRKQRLGGTLNYYYRYAA